MKYKKKIKIHFFFTLLKNETNLISNTQNNNNNNKIKTKKLNQKQTFYNKKKMENEFSCKICFEKYDVTYRKPTILMLCAHTICNICLKGLKNYECPTCRDEIISTKPNFALIEQLEIILNSNSGKFLTLYFQNTIASH